VNDGNSDKKLVDFLKQYRPNIPEGAPDLEQKLLAAIERKEVDRPDINHLEAQLTAFRKKPKICCFPKWIFPPAIAAGMIFFGAGYRLLVTAPVHPNEAHLEAFLVNNWEGAVNGYSGENPGDRPQTDWLNFDGSANSEPQTNN